MPERKGASYRIGNTRAQQVEIPQMRNATSMKSGGDACCSYCGAGEGQSCTDRRGRPPIRVGSPDTGGEQREVYDHWPGRKSPFNPKPKPQR